MIANDRKVVQILFSEITKSPQNLIRLLLEWKGKKNLWLFLNNIFRIAARKRPRLSKHTVWIWNTNQKLGHNSILTKNIPKKKKLGNIIIETCGLCRNLMDTAKLQQIILCLNRATILKLHIEKVKYSVTSKMLFQITIFTDRTTTFSQKLHRH